MIGPLTQIEGRTLGTIIEKESLLPYNYPIAFGRLLKGINQKTNRGVVMHITEVELTSALDSLLRYKLIKSELGYKNTTIYSHIITDTLKIPTIAVPLIAVLLLRGPLTTSEMRIAVQRIYKYPNNSMIEQLMKSFTKKFREDPLIVQLPRTDLKFRPRWTQLLTGPINVNTDEIKNFNTLQKDIADLNTRLLFLECRLGVRSSLE